MKTVPTCVDVVPQFSASEASVLPSATSTIPHTLRSVRDERAESATARRRDARRATRRRRENRPHRRGPSPTGGAARDWARGPTAMVGVGRGSGACDRYVEVVTGVAATLHSGVHPERETPEHGGSRRFRSYCSCETPRPVIVAERDVWPESTMRSIESACGESPRESERHHTTRSAAVWRRRSRCVCLCVPHRGGVAGAPPRPQHGDLGVFHRRGLGNEVVMRLRRRRLARGRRARLGVVEEALRLLLVLELLVRHAVYRDMRRSGRSEVAREEECARGAEAARAYLLSSITFVDVSLRDGHQVRTSRFSNGRENHFVGNGEETSRE